MEKDVRRFLLRPLSRRQRAVDQRAIIAALDRLDHRAIGEDLVSQLRDVVSEARRDGKESWKNPEKAGKQVALARALYTSRRISTQEYVYFAVHPVEAAHEARWFDGHYELDLEPIDRAIKAIETSGLTPSGDWVSDEAAGEYLRLSDQYSTALALRFVATLREFGLDDIADLHEQNRVEFKRLRERGRRSVFHRDELVPSLRDIVVRYEEDARKAAFAGAYSAAVTLLGAGVEGLLLLRCLRSKQKALRVAQELPKRLRSRLRNSEDPTEWTFEVLIEVCLRAGWLRPVSTQIADYDTASLAHLLRLTRNHVHPGKQARERPWLETDKRDYKDAEAIYLALLSTLGYIRREKSA